MSDLISRKKVIDILEKEKNLKCGYDADIAIFSIEKGIKEMATAYDIDKVVNKLEETMKDLSVIEVFSHIDFDRTIQSGLDNFLKAYNSELLRIVKNGGVDDDVCEWESASDGEFIQNPHTKRLYSNEPSMRNVYCNTCGNKIKIVGD